MNSLSEPGVGLRRERAVALSRGACLDTHGDGRHCLIDGCGTVLSRYNPDGVCGPHGGWRLPSRSGGGKGRTAAAS